MHHPLQPRDSASISLPLKFAGGFGIDSRRIGAIFTIFAISSTVCQFLVFPPLARRLGVLYCLRLSFLIFPAVFFVTPFIALIDDARAREATMVALLMVRGVAGTFAFPTSTIMLTNSATSLRVLGTINGLATSVSAVGRAVGPTIGGGLFTWGVKRGYVIVPFWALSAIALAASVPTWWLVEGKGFGGEEEQESEEEQSDDEERESGVESATERSAPMVDSAGRSESDFGEPATMLSYTSTRSSMVADSEDGNGLSDGEWPSQSLGSGGRGSCQVERVRSHDTARRRNMQRRSSVPIGMGPGFRRYSSNLGSSGAIGNGGVSWGGI